ncbi:Protein prune-like protein 2 [Acropora cervicornis]|uniref:Protein prune-like protein 2 n=1 Tax=Acropora cervicornis TaxID=6130 RepID=A0AAD9R6J2_ACRCE|nr:Protein prune-like protein 2 [Acropora cervicornis]
MQDMQIESDNVETNERPSSTPFSYEDTFAEESYKMDDCRQLPVLQVAFDNEGVAETSFSIPNAPEPIAEGIEEPSVNVPTPIDCRSKSKENSFVKHSPGKWPPVFNRKRGSSLLNTGSEESECSDEDSCSEFSDDEERIAPFKEFISLRGAKTKEGEDILVLNPSKIPSKREFPGKKEYGEVMDSLFLYAQKFTEEKIEADKFVLLVHSMNQRSRLRSRKWAAEFYKLLKERYIKRMSRCVFYKPSFKLRAMVILSWPFLADDMKEKICIVKSLSDVNV